MKNNHFLNIIGLLCLIVIGCKNDDDIITVEENQNPGDFSVEVNEVTTNSASITWDAPVDPDNDPLSYTIILDNDEIVSNYISTTFALEGLAPNTSYSGSVIASDGNNGTSESTFTFDTGEEIIDTQIHLVWEKSYGGSRIDIANSLELTTDGGYIIAGTSYSDDGDVGGNNDADNYLGGDVWVVKLNSSGDLEWETNLGGSLDERGDSIQQTSDGGYIVTGTTNSSQFDTNGNFDAWVIKLDASGNIVWENTYGGGSNDSANDIQQTTDGGYIVAGFSGASGDDVSENNGSLDYWIIKIDASGVLEWETSLGGSETDIANAVEQTTDGGYIVAGYSESSDHDVNGNNGEKDYWIVKLDPLGNLVWGEHFGGNQDEIANGIQQTTDGGYIVAGFSESSTNDVSNNYGGKDYWIVKLNTSGQLVWESNYGSSESDIAESIQQTSDQGYIIAGNSATDDFDVSSDNGGFADYWIVKLDSLGEISWEFGAGGPEGDFATAIRQSSDGYIAAGYVKGPGGDISGMGKGQWDYWVIKLE
ncbi:fibronectin type III domain-containing protein [Aquimarina sp. D1M17]|uniref:fibronectin type III domain-containing protein n=1 Tax=Aquimarina acroporae TaxID=2937283 RepID=UPI0020BFB591|nr:fibronectin type III domain-containing protein [Aquimarina acroporae]MCK8523623.1 fibronectin type III domain-containing protein [Aquimarina acroporae]